MMIREDILIDWLDVDVVMDVCACMRAWCVCKLVIRELRGVYKFPFALH